MRWLSSGTPIEARPLWREGVGCLRVPLGRQTGNRASSRSVCRVRVGESDWEGACPRRRQGVTNPHRVLEGEKEFAPV